jgi:hypothetical protein
MRSCNGRTPEHSHNEEDFMRSARGGVIRDCGFAALRIKCFELNRGGGMQRGYGD